MSRNAAIIFFIAIGFIVINLIGLDRSPIIWGDEILGNDPARELAFNGKLRSCMYEDKSGYEEVYLAHAPGHPLVIAAVYKIFGFGILQTRIPPLVFGAGIIVVLYFLTLLLFNNQRAALLSSLFFALDPNVIQAFRSGRADAQYLFFAFLGIWIYLHAETTKGKLHFLYLALSGLALGLALITHPVSAPLALALGVLILIPYKGSRLKDVFLFSVFSSVPIIIFWFISIRNATVFFMLQFMPHLQSHLMSGSLFSRIAKIALSIWRSYQWAPLLLAAYILSFLWVIMNPAYQKRSRIIVGLLVAAPLLFTFFGATSHFQLYLIPVLAIASGVFFCELLAVRNSSPTRIRYALIRVFIVLVMANTLMRGIIGRYLTLTCQWKARDYRPIEFAIQESIPKGSVVLSAPEAWYAVENAGAHFRLLGAPDPYRHNYVIARAGIDANLLIGFRKIREIGQPLRPVLGKIKLPRSLGYRMEIWQSEKRFPRQ